MRSSTRTQNDDMDLKGIAMREFDGKGNFRSLRQDDDDVSESFPKYHRLRVIIAAVLCSLLVMVLIGVFTAIIIPRYLPEEPGSNLAISPNLIVIVADNLGRTEGDPELIVSTLFLSKLRNIGVRITNYYSQEASVPSRSALLTGRYPITSATQSGNVKPTVGWGMSTNEVLLPTVLQNAGYGTYFVGDWSLGHASREYLPTARGFDHFVGSVTDESCRSASGTSTKYHDLMYANKECYALYNTSNLYKHPTLFRRDKAINVIKRHNYTKPLFLMVTMDVEYEDAFLTDVWKNHLPYGRYAAVMTSVSARERQQYLLSTALMDDAVGRIYGSIKAVQQLQNTYFVFM